MKDLTKPLVGLVLVLVGIAFAWTWVVCRVYVNPGEILVITSKFGETNANPDNDRVVS